jgi:alkyl sulfatase BDS1-like metallo-beta-lactamase superfamily hydrolase
MDQVVFADPGNQPARNLEADALEQLGYETENPTWRNEFLMGAFELRNGVPKVPGIDTVTPDAVRAVSTELLLDYMGVRLNGEKANGKTISINWTQPENGKEYALRLENSVLVYTKDEKLPNPDVTLRMSHDAFATVLMGGSSFDQETANGHAQIQGDGAKLTELMSMLDTFPKMFNIVIP